MQAVILAAGMGSRLKDITKNKAKCMVEVNEIPLIKRMLEQLEAYDLTRIVIVVGYEKERLIEYIESLNINVPIEYVVNEQYKETNNIYSLYLAKDYLKEETLLLESDLIFEEQVLEKIVNTKEANVAVVAKYENWMDGTVTLLDQHQIIKKIVAKSEFKYEDIDKYYKTVNIYKFSAEFLNQYYIPFLEFHCNTLGVNSYYEQVLSMLIDLDKLELYALCLEREVWYEIDDLQDLNIAESLFDTEALKLKKVYSRYGGYWRYPKMIDFCYLVNPLFPSKKMMDEMKQQFEVLVTNYPSGASVNNLLVAKYFGINEKCICVGNGAAELIKVFVENIKGKVGIIYPTFEEYPNCLNAEQIEAYYPQNEKYSYSADDLIAYYEGKEIEVLTLINPDNPSGNYIDFEGLERLLAWTKENNINFILDESFIDFSEEGVTLLQQEILDENPQLIVIKSISKSYGVPGIRLGVLASSNREIMESVKENISIWNINSFGEYYLQIFEKYKAEYKNALEEFKVLRTQLDAGLKEVSYIRTIKSQANYIMCEVINSFTARKLAEILLSKNQILIKDLSDKKGFENKEYIRIAVRDAKDNQRLIDALKDLERQ